MADVTWPSDADRFSQLVQYDDVAERLLKAEAVHLIVSALDTILSPSEAIVIRLGCLAEMPRTVVAETIGLSYEVVRRIELRAMNKLRAHISRCWG